MTQAPADGLYMTGRKRSPWFGLNAAQLMLIDEEIDSPERCRMKSRHAYADLADEFARRAAALLAANDVRGALWFADVWAYCDSHARGEPFRHAIRDGGGIVENDPATALSRAQESIMTKAEPRQIFERGAAPRLAHHLSQDSPAPV